MTVALRRYLKGDLNILLLFNEMQCHRALLEESIYWLARAHGMTDLNWREKITDYMFDAMSLDQGKDEQ